MLAKGGTCASIISLVHDPGAEQTKELRDGVRPGDVKARKGNPPHEGLCVAFTQCLLLHLL